MIKIIVVRDMDAIIGILAVDENEVESAVDAINRAIPVDEDDPFIDVNVRNPNTLEDILAALGVERDDLAED